MSQLSIVPEGHNLSVYFILPLIGLNKFSFGGGENFCNSYISYNGRIVSVVRDKDVLGKYWEHPNYLTDFDVEISEQVNGTAIIYAIPKEFDDDISLFLEGAYSKFSTEALEKIRAHSGLPYRTPIIGSSGFNTHKLLLVLEKSSVLKKWIEEKIGSVIDPDKEFLPKPEASLEFLDIDTISA